MAWPSWKGKTVIRLNDRFNWRRVGHCTVGSSSRRGPMRLRDTLSMLRAGRARSSAVSDCNLLHWRSSRVKLLKLYNKKRCGKVEWMHTTILSNCVVNLASYQRDLTKRAGKLWQVVATQIESKEVLDLLFDRALIHQARQIVQLVPW